MKQFDLYGNTDPDSNRTYPFFVDVQTGLLEQLNSRLVIPITPVKNAKLFPENLCPVVKIVNKEYAPFTHQITTVSAYFLAKRDSSLLLKRDEIISALDFLLTGI